MEALEATFGNFNRNVGTLVEQLGKGNKSQATERLFKSIYKLCVTNAENIGIAMGNLLSALDGQGEKWSSDKEIRDIFRGLYIPHQTEMEK